MNGFFTIVSLGATRDSYCFNLIVCTKALQSDAQSVSVGASLEPANNFARGQIDFSNRIRTGFSNIDFIAIGREQDRDLPGFGVPADFDRALGSARCNIVQAKRAIAQWNDLPGDATGDAVLIDPDRQLMETAIQALLKNRDDRPVTIKE